MFICSIFFLRPTFFPTPLFHTQPPNLYTHLCLRGSLFQILNLSLYFYFFYPILSSHDHNFSFFSKSSSQFHICRLYPNQLRKRMKKTIFRVDPSHIFTTCIVFIIVPSLITYLSSNHKWSLALYVTEIVIMIQNQLSSTHFNQSLIS